jgi:ABC-type thiamin/hydroxymethylpyrimidine transport system permease subunit
MGNGLLSTVRGYIILTLVVLLIVVLIVAGVLGLLVAPLAYLTELLGVIFNV